jgi:signal transduction histidine kinase
MSETQNYKKAYERQKEARERAEALLEARSGELFDANATLKNAYNTLHDQKAQLVQQEKLASIGMLAAGVAHEINNPVGFVKSNLQTLQEYSKSYMKVLKAYRDITKLIESKHPDAATKQSLEDLQQLLNTTDLENIAEDGLACIEESLFGVYRVEEIVNNLREFSRSDSDDRVKINVNDSLESAIKLVWNEVKYNVKVERDYGDLPATWAINGQIVQVFVNIIYNAIQAMARQGQLIIKTQSDPHFIHTDIIDSGPGIEEKYLSKLFDPFFTTKDIGSGTGLGLYISHGIIDKHKGKLLAYNDPEAGARFRVSLPIEARKKDR